MVVEVLGFRAEDCACRVKIVRVRVQIVGFTTTDVFNGWFYQPSRAAQIN